MVALLIWVRPLHEPPQVRTQPAAAPAAVDEAAWPTEPRVKGESLLRVYAKRGENVFRVTDGAELMPGDAIRFVPDAAGYPMLLILSVEDRGRSTPFFPYGGLFAAPIPNAPGSPLPGSIVLDASLGGETLWAVFSKEPVAAAELRAWASAPAADAVSVESAAADRSVRVFKLRFSKVPADGSAPAGRGGP